MFLEGVLIYLLLFRAGEDFSFKGKRILKLPFLLDL